MEKEKEIEYLRKRSERIIDFMISLDPANSILLKYKMIIQNVVKKKDSRGLRMVARDLNEWAKGLSQKEILELERILKLEFEENLSGDKLTYNTIEKLLTTGIIQTEDEYRLVQECLNDISKGDPLFEKKKELEALLRTF
ncbi:MAG: hypothetical protein ACJLTB_17810 [Algoriphagus aquaeductus]|uniref:hypothetical protein n=1 Tax=Algoriphagus aquaeductus TaxID=475299 RepID=UPI0038796BFF